MKGRKAKTAIPVYKNGKQGRMVAFFSRLNPANWFNDFKNIKISLEEFDNIKKEKKIKINAS